MNLPWAILRSRGRLQAGRPPLHLIAPGLMVGSAMLLPLVYLLLRAAGVGGNAWQAVLNLRMGEVLFRSVALAASVTASSTLIAVPLAWLTVRTDLPLRRWWAVITTLPLVIPSYVGGFAVVAAFGPRGLVQQALAEPFGIERLPEIYGFPGAWAVLTLFAYPYVLLNVRTALRGLDPSLEEAARSLGDGAFRVFWRVTLPHLRPAIASGGLLVALYVLSDFGAVSMLRYTTFTRAIYLQYSASFDRNLAALLALVLVVLTSIVLMLESQAQGEARVYYHRPQSRKLTSAKLGAWKLPALLFCGGVMFFSLMVPLGVITYWLITGLRTGESFTLWFDPIWRSVLASGLASLMALLGALPVALLIVRFPGLFSKLIERASYIGYALPGIVVALSLVFLGANFLTFLYQTLPMLVFAYVVRYLPQATGTLRTAVMQVSPRIEEAARGLGGGAAKVLFTIIIPLLKSGLLAGGALVFLTSMKELPATLLLAPTGYDTLATRVWSATQEAFYARASVPALMLVLVSALSVGFILERDEVRRF